MKLIDFLFYFLMAVAFILIMLHAPPSPASTLERDIRAIAEQENFNPELAVAVARTESKLDTTKVGSKGEIGLFQLHPEYHKISKNYRTNIRTAIRYLKHVKQVCEPKFQDAWIICYNLGPYYSKEIRHPKLFPYYKQIIKNLKGDV